MILDQVTVQLTRVNCWCGVVFGIPEQSWNELQRKLALGQPQSLTCPVNGHTMHWQGKDDLRRAQDSLAREQHRREQAEERAREECRRKEAAQRQVSARKAVATKLRKKISAGRCPCCSHRFADLKKHMRTEHPKWNPELAAEAIAKKGAA